LKLLGLVSLFALLVARPDVARADEGSTSVGVQASVAGGPWFATSQSEVDAELTRVGWPELPPVSPEFQIRFGLTVFNATIDLHFQGSDQSVSGSPGAKEGLDYHRGAIGVDLGYRFRLGRLFTLSPFVGIGSVDSTLCFAGQPDATSSTSSPPFEQILRNPGISRCLKASDVGLDAGLTLAANIRFEFERQKDLGLFGYLSIGPRFSFMLPLASTRTWEQTSSGLEIELPAFEGPLGPLAGAYAGLEVQFRFSMEAVP
jgi:hypothetical protein